MKTNATLDHDHRLKIETALAEAVVRASRDANGVVHIRSTEILVALINSLVGHVVLADWLQSEEEATTFANGVAGLIVESWKDTKARIAQTPAPDNVEIIYADPTARKH